MLSNNSKSNQSVARKNNNHNFAVPTALFLGIVSFLGIPASTQAACNTYYVATNGNDSNPGTIDKPRFTIGKVAWGLKACDTLYVRGGIYNQYGIYVPNSGTANQPIKILAYSNEKPILDGNNRPGTWTEFFALDGSYITLSGFEAKNGSVGVVMRGHHNTVSNMIVHDVQHHGIWAKGDYSTVQNSQVWFAALEQRSHPSTEGWAFGIGAAQDQANGITDHAILQGNTVHDVWGEGITTWEADGTIVENNIAYDNWAQNTYISDAFNVIYRNNMAYNTPNNYVGKRAPGLTLADEQPTKLRSHNNVVINNRFYNADICAFCWTLVDQSGLVGDLIANNTLVNGAIATNNKDGVRMIVNQATWIQNNIVYRTDGGNLASAPSNSGLTFRNNLWSQKPVPYASGPSDVIGNPGLAQTGSTAAGQLTKSYFTVTNTLLTNGRGAPIFALTDDFLVTNSSPTVNIGIYGSALPVQFVAP